MAETIRVLERLYDEVACNAGEIESIGVDVLGASESDVQSYLKALNWVLQLVDEFIGEQEVFAMMEKGELKW